MSTAPDGYGSAGRAGGTLEVLAFDQGYEAGMHPRLDGQRSGGVAVTTTLSTWLGLACTTCRHTFRVGDRVLVGGSMVRHLDPALKCGATQDGATRDSEAQDDATQDDATQDDGNDVEDFARGLLEAWPAASGVPVRLRADDWRVAWRGSRSTATTCPVCAHTFRPGDTVIICPCARSSDSPDTLRCQLAIHRDPVIGLTCWDDWRPDGQLVRCPITREPPR